MPDLPLKQLGDYRIEARIGSGGMGVVYRAYDARLERTVALKTLSLSLASDEDCVAQFRTEATAMASVRHPNVVPIHFIGQERELVYFVMQYVEGESLAHRLARRRLTLEQAVGLAEQCLAGLAATHAMGVVHRDVKPANILLDSETGRALLVDFGLARRGDQDAATAGAAILGTFDYFSPEQALGQEADRRADIYSMGAVFYQMLSGRLPFEADTPAAMIYLHAYESPRPLKDVAPDVVDELGRIIERMMAKSPADRYGSCEEVLERLRAVRTHDPRWATSKTTIIFASPQPEDEPENQFGDQPVAVAKLPSWAARRLQGLRSLAATCFRRYAPEFVQQLQSTSQQVDAAVAAIWRRRDRVARLLSEAQAVDHQLDEQIRANEMVESVPALDADASESARQRRQCEENVAALESLRRQQREEIEEIELQLARAETSLARVRAQHDALKARLRAAEVRGRIDAGWRKVRRRFPWKKIAVAALLVIAALVAAGVYWPAQRPSSLPDEILADASRPTTSSPDARPRENYDHLVEHYRRLLQTLGGHTGRVRAVAFSPDGTLLASGGDDRTVVLRDIPSGAVRRTLRGHPGEVCALAFSPRGDFLASFSKGGTLPKNESDPARPNYHRKILILWRVADGRLQAKLDMPREPSVPEEFPDNPPSSLDALNYSVAISPDAKTVACSGWSLSAVLCDVADGALRQSLLPSAKVPAPKQVRSHELSSTAFSHDGATLATGSGDGAIRLWDPATGKLLRELQATSESVGALAFHPQGATLAAAHYSAIDLWDTTTWTRRRAPGSHMGPIEALAFSPDGSLIASVSARDRILLRDAKTGRPCLGLGPMDIYSVAFSPDGSQLATGSKDGTVQLWSVPKSLRLEMPTIVAQSPSAPVAAADKPELAENELGRLEGHTDGVGDVQFLPDGRQLVSAGTDRTVRLWDIESRTEVRRFTGFAGPVDGVAAAPSGKEILFCDGANGLVLWDLAAQRAVRRFDGHYNCVRCVRIFPDGRTAVSGGDDGRVIAWDMSTGGKLSEMEYWRRDSPIHAVAVSRQDMQAVATTSTSRAAISWRPRAKGEGSTKQSAVMMLETIRGCAFHPRANPPLIFLCGGDNHADAKDFVIRLCSIKGYGQIVRQFVGHTAAPYALDVSSDGALLVSGGADKTVRLWDVERAKEVARFEGHTGTVRAVAFSPDDARIASGSSDGTVRIWRVPDPRALLVAASAGHKTAVRSAAVALLSFDSDSSLRSGNQWLIADSSEAGNHFIAPSSTSFCQGRIGTAVQLDNTVLRLPRILVCGRAAYSLAFWVRPRKTDIPMTIYREEGSPNHASASVTIFRVGLDADGSVEIEANRPGATTQAASVRTPAGLIPQNRWTFLAVCRTDGSPAKVTLWINDKSTTHSLQVAEHPAPVATLLGQAPADLNELMVFNRALSNEEVQTIFLLGVDGRSLAK